MSKVTGVSSDTKSSVWEDSSYFIGAYLHSATFESEEVSGQSKTLLGKMGKTMQALILI